MRLRDILCFLIFSCALQAQTVSINGTTYASITAAVSAASNGDVIDITGTHNENLSWNDKNLTIRGTNPATDIIDGGGTDSVFNFSVPASGILNITLENISITNGGGVTRGGGVFYDVGPSGSGTLTLNNVIVQSNSATNEGGGIATLGGSLTLNNCSFLSNTSINDGGGIIVTSKNDQAIDININNSLFQGNSGRNGGGIYLNGNGGTTSTQDVDIVNSTFFGNSATSPSGGGGGGAIWSKAKNDDPNVTLTLVHVTLDNNSHASSAKNGLAFSASNSWTNIDIYNSLILNGDDLNQKAIKWGNSKVSNVVNTIFGGIIDGNTNVDGVTANSILNDGTKNNTTNVTRTSAGLATTLSSSGGSNQVLTIPASSIPEDYCTVATGATIPNTDQRGYYRVGTYDAGAYEVDGADPTGPTVFIETTYYSSIANAIAASSNGDIVLISGTHSENLSWNNKNITLRGTDPSSDIIDGGTSGQVISMFGGTAQEVTFENLTLKNGAQTGNGGAIYYDIGSGGTSGTITLTRCIIEDNTATSNGGAIAMLGGNLTINNCIIRNNTATANAGGIMFANKGVTVTTMNITNTLIQGNSGPNGGGIYINANVTTRDIDINITNTTIASNTATSGGSGDAGGGAIWSKAANNSSNVDLSLVHVTTYGNSHTGSDGKNGISCTGGGTAFTNFSIYNSILAGTDDLTQKAVNWVKAKPIDIVNSILGGLNAAGTDVDGVNANTFLDDGAKNNQKGRTATQAGLTGTLTDKGGFSNVIPITESSAADDFCSVATGITLPTSDQRGFARGTPPDAGAFEYNSSVTWSGATNTDWATSSNWDYGVPVEGQDVTIADMTNAPVISSATSITLNDLNITEPDGLTINSGGSLIVNGSSSGDLNYVRTLDTDNWYLVSSPVIGQDIDAFALSENLEEGTGNLFGLAPYNNDGTDWEYYIGGSSGSGAFTPGKGYSVLLDAPSNIMFTGNMPTSDYTSLTLTDNSGASGNGFNLMGNPYPSYIALNNSANGSANLLDNNASLLAQETVWLWNQDTSSYDIYNQATGAFHIAPGQGFFVLANGNSSSFAITEAMQSHQSDTFQRNSTTNPQVELVVSNNSFERSTKLFYIDGTTTDFDNGYDSSIFEGVDQDFIVYSHCADNVDSRNLGIQSLPPSGTENIGIPIGIKASSGTSLTFNTITSNIDDNMLIYLEDTSLGILTDLTNNNETYSVYLTEDMDGIGRFYLIVTPQVLSTVDNQLNNIGIFTTRDPNELKIIGVLNGKTEISIYNINGQKLLNTFIQSNDSINYISCPKMETGIYIAQLKNQDGQLTKKVIINN